MKNLKRYTAHLVVLLVLLLAASAAHAQSGDPYSVTWSSINSGGTSNSGAYTLNAMLSSQGTTTSTGGNYTLGGVWSGPPAMWPQAYLPLIQR